MANGNETTAETGVLDLRPPKGSIVYQLLRLGLTFDHGGTDGEVWCDYTRGVTAVLKDRQATEVTISDMDTKSSATVTATKLATVTEIKTWRSDEAGE